MTTADINNLYSTKVLPTKQELITRLFKDGHITIDDVFTLLEDTNYSKQVVYTPYISNPPFPGPYEICASPDINSKI